MKENKENLLNFQITIPNIFQKCLATLTKSNYHLIFKNDMFLISCVNHVSSDSKVRLVFTDALISISVL